MESLYEIIGKMAPAVGIKSIIEFNNFSKLGSFESDVNRHLW